MATAEQSIKAFTSGTHNLLPNEIIPKDAASDSLGWITRDGHIEISYGRRTIGGAGAAGKNYAEHTAYRADGTAVRIRKVNGTIQTNVPSVNETWTNVITGLTATADYVCSNYQSLAGAFVYLFGVDGIYKICTANPTDYATLYDSTKNFKGYGFIDKARTILWGRREDPTGLYGSYIDAQNSTVYTTVSGEATGSLGGTLAFKSGDAKRTCFGVTITIASTGEVYTDNFNGVLTGTLGGTGTINYMTGVYTLSNPGTGTASYQWEMSNNKGVTDFTKSATRLAGEGFIVRQDAGGDAIVAVIPLDGSYFSIKAHSCYKFTLDSDDLNPLNEIFRTDIGVSSLRSAVGTGKGIVFINTSNLLKPKMEILQRNPLGDNFDVVQLFPHFKFENYSYSDALVDTWDEYVIVACKENTSENNRLLLCNIKQKTVDVMPYGIRTSTKVNGVLYGGDPVSQTTYELFTGFDDLTNVIQNNWDSRGEIFGDEVLKKVKKNRFKGKIVPGQSVRVSISVDDGDFQVVGTILGTGDYVDYSSSFAIGTSALGVSSVGGDNEVSIYSFFMEIKLHVPKFRKRVIRFEALGFGYVSIEQITDFDIWTYQQKLPSRYRSKQNVALAGTPTDMDNPDY